MKRRILLAAVGAAVLTVSAFGWPRAALAQTAAQQAQSNQSLDQIAARINQDISALNGDDTDYGGHRIAAIKQMQIAHNQIQAAEQYAATHGKGANAANPGSAVAMAGGGVRRQQGQSDQNIAAVKTDLQAVLNQLNADSADYGGHKGNAATALGNAITELGKAQAYRQTHAPGT